ncbi:hypothetical protein CW304_03025 [Bacillus sp. UFRGS-B20]|nr:hypothetical protein CW304_03025 [Bacillus sp. UFRGS-B20]
MAIIFITYTFILNPYPKNPPRNTTYHSEEFSVSTFTISTFFEKRKHLFFCISFLLKCYLGKSFFLLSLFHR